MYSKPRMGFCEMLNWRFLTFLTLVSLLVYPARAEIENPDLLEIASNYHRSVVSKSTDRSSADILRELNEARKIRDLAAIVDLSEQLVSLGPDNVQTWLDLSRAWFESNRSAQNGLASAIYAAGVASENSDRIEALLLASAFLRNQLAAHRQRYDDARTRADAATAGLVQAESLEGAEDFTGPESDDPKGRIAVLKKTLEEANLATEAAADDISYSAAALDEIYRELQVALPRLDVEDLQKNDSRLEFYAEQNEYGEIITDIDTRGNDIRACLTFNKPLIDDSRQYGDWVEIHLEGEVGNYQVRAKDDQLCILGLKPGKYYEPTLLPEFAARDGTTLGEQIDFGINVPDLPPRIGFGDGEYILATDSRVGIPVSLTNVEVFPLSVHRIVSRSVNRHLALGHIRNGVPNGEYQDLINHFSEVLWQGTAERTLREREKNATIRTVVPVRTILEDRKSWIETLDPDQWDKQGTRKSEPRQVRAVNDESLEITGTFLAGRMDVDAAAPRFVPGVYALVTPVLDTGLNKADYCGGDDSCTVYAAQWFLITDIGLTFYEGEREFTVLARSLAGGGAMADAKIQLVSKGNRVLAEKRTDANGVAVFDRSLTAGVASNALVAVMAETDTDFSFLRFGPERLDLSRLNVGSDGDDEPYEAVLYTDRGIYQPGETVNVLPLLRQRDDLEALDGASEIRLVVNDYVIVNQPIAAARWRDGGTLVPVTVPSTARPGTAYVRLMSGSGKTLAETRIQIGRIRPDRARLEFSEDDTSARPASPGTAEIFANVRAQYLYGVAGTSQAPASKLKAEIAVRVSPSKTLEGRCYEDYAFGKFDDDGLPTVSRSFVEYTDEDGLLDLHLTGVRLPATTRPVVAGIEVTLFDASGPLATKQEPVEIPVSDTALGLRELPRIHVSDDGEQQIDLDLLVVDGAGRGLRQRRLNLRLEREVISYAWENVEGAWQHVRLQNREVVGDREIDIADYRSDAAATTDCEGQFQIVNAFGAVDDGRYIITVTDPASGSVVSTRFNTGVAQTSVDDLEPNIFQLASDKERYAAGDRMELEFDAPFRDGEVVIAIASRDIVSWHKGTVIDGKGTASIDIDPSWQGSGYYALVTAFQSGDLERRLGPARAIGATYFEVAGGQSLFELSIARRDAGLENVLRPGEPLRFDLCVAMEANGPCADQATADVHAAVFVVDEGLLNLTGHTATLEEANEAIAGRSRLGLRVMDNYGRLLLKEGGDRPGRLALSNYTSKRIVAHAQGPVTLAGGRASFEFDDIELQSGSLEIYAIAWSTDHVTSVSSVIPVRRFVVSSLGVADFYFAGDQPILPLRLENISFAGHDGNYKLDFSAEAGIGVELLDATGRPLDRDPSGSFLLPIPVGQPRDLLIRLNIPQDAVGSHELALDLSVAGGSIALPPEERRRTWTLDVRAPWTAATEYLSFPLGDNPVDLAQLIEGVVSGRYDPQSLKVHARFAGEADTLNLASLDNTSKSPMEVLDEIVWRGMADLQNPSLKDDRQLAERVQGDIEKVQSLQLTDGVFVPYRAIGDFIPSEIGFDKNTGMYTIRHGLMRNATALDFLSRARRGGFAVSPDAIRNSIAFVKGRVSDAIGNRWNDAKLLCSFGTRYAMLVLAQLNELNADEIDALDYCLKGGQGIEPADTSPLSHLVTLAVQTEFGKDINAGEILRAEFGNPATVLDGLDDYRRVLAISLMANARLDRGMIDEEASRFVQDSVPLDPRARFWLARLASDLTGAGSSSLTIRNISASEPGLADLSEHPGGIIESREMEYADIVSRSLTVSRSGGPQSRGYLEMTGRRLDDLGTGLPPDQLGVRLFSAGTGREIDIGNQDFEVGDELVVVVEATKDAFQAYSGLDYSDIAFRYGPLAVDVTLPSAFALVAEDTSGISAEGDFGKLDPVGNIRSIGYDSQNWKAIVIPSSSEAVMTHDADEQLELSPATDTEIRIAFVVSVVASGKFVFPSIAIDPLDFPGDTLLSSRWEFDVTTPSNARR